MYFKSLEIYGFKSFGEKTKLAFEPGVTAIVGPNGCGKSNISDSIRWALGEQSAKALRGTRMEDLIFNGTAAQEPLGFCEVTVTFSNESKALPIEYDEVSITRRLFRSGESEYLINKNQVRLKDIQDLIAGTGIGTDSYSMIGQGKIDLILSSKPDERRAIFEEASGITKYKSKKREALRKLEHTENNLVRINDIIAEVARQIATVERQAQKAERYKVRFEELKTLDLQVSRLDRDFLAEKLKNLEETIATSMARDAEMNSQLTGGNALLEQDRQRVEELDGELSEQSRNLNLIQTRIETNKQRFAFGAERTEELKRRGEDLEVQIRAGQEKQKDLGQELDTLRAQVNAVSTDTASLEENVRQREQALEQVAGAIDGAKKALEQGKTDLIDFSNRETHLHNTITRLTTQLHSAHTRERRLAVEKEDAGIEFAEAEEKLNEARAVCEKQRDQVVVLRAEHEQLEAHHKELSSQLDELRRTLEAKKEIFTSCSSKLELLEAAQMSYEGYSKGAKTILEMKNAEGEQAVPEGFDTEKILGSIPSLIDVDKEYEVAVEAALSENVQTILVAHSNDARMLFDHLAAGSCGRATLMTPDLSEDNAAAHNAPEEEILSRDGVLGKAVTYVNCADDIRWAITRLLRDVYIVRDLETAISLARYSAVFVTPNGERVRQGTASGGVALHVEETGLIGRERRIKELRQEKEVLAGDIGNMQQTITKVHQEFELVDQKMDAIAKLLHEAAVELSNKEAVLNGVESDYEKIKEELDLVDLELKEVAEEVEDLNKRKEQADGELAELNEKIAATEAIIQESERTMGLKAHDREVILLEITEKKTELSSLQQRVSYLEQNKERLERAMGDETATLAARQEELELSRKRIEDIAAEREKLQQDVTDLQEEEGVVSQTLRVKQQAKSELNIAIRAREEEQEQVRQTLDELRNKVRSVEVEKAECTFEVRAIDERVIQTYNVRLDAVEMTEGFDAREAKEMVKDLKRKLDNMGTVNLVAIEEHQELKERYVFLTAQQEDLARAKDSLLRAIDKINRTTKQLFLETFSRIQDEFSGYFKLLFGGGEAKLYLVDAHDVLESGIEIEARPPGKRLQNITLLSGGERALTAISLLFSIFKVKPSPFCILDEIDAPLDESNIDRFTRLLREFLKESQFMIVTHNKKTINMADIMYGITMQKSGISKIVSVKFTEGADASSPDAKGKSPEKKPVTEEQPASAEQSAVEQPSEESTPEEQSAPAPETTEQPAKA